MSMTWLLCDYGEVLALAPSVADRDALESEAGTGGPSFWAGYWQHRPAYDRADIDTARYWTQVLGHVPGAARLRRIAQLDTIMWSRPNQASLDAAVGAAERGVKLALLSNAPARLDDRLENVLAARRAGMRAALFTNSSQLS
jgi:putative hydrolase of the HAD superfamily